MSFEQTRKLLISNFAANVQRPGYLMETKQAKIRYCCEFSLFFCLKARQLAQSLHNQLF
jgi:hypothetical protein